MPDQYTRTRAQQGTPALELLRGALVAMCGNGGGRGVRGAVVAVLGIGGVGGQAV